MNDTQKSPRSNVDKTLIRRAVRKLMGVGLTEPAAYHALRVQAMDGRVPMVEVAVRLLGGK